MSVVLVNPINDFASFKSFEVLSLGYLASYLEGAGVDVEIYDCNFEDPRPSAIASACRDRAASAIGFTTMVGTLRHVMVAASAIRRELPQVPIICGGYAATFEGPLLLQECRSIDFVLRGEGELSFAAWLAEVNRIEGGYDSVPGLSYRAHGDLRTIPGPVLVNDLDALPFPRRSRHLDRIGVASMLSSRGCAARCSFCSIQEFYRLSSKGAIRCRTATNVVDEIESIHRAYGITRFLFVDDNFFMSEAFMRGRLSAIAETLVERGLDGVRFEVSSRAIDLRVEQLAELIEAGLDTVYVGLESGSAAQLQRYRKGCGPATNVRAVDELRRRGVRIDFGFIPWDPYVQPDELIDSFRFLLDQDLIRPETLNTLSVTVDLFPGTELNRRAAADGLLHRTDDYYYWFDFSNREMAPIYEQILVELKTSYFVNVVDEYSNGLRQKGWTGPSAEVVTAWLRRLCRLWVDRFEALLTRRDVNNLDRGIANLEWFLTNALTAHTLLNRARIPGGPPMPGAAMARLESDGRELLALLREGRMSDEWTEPLRVDREYRERRNEELEAQLFYETRVQLPKDDEVIIDIPPLPRAVVIDIFVAPDIDRPPDGTARPAGMPPPTLYLGSVTGMTPIECHFTRADDTLVHACRLLKGWTEINVPDVSIRRIRLVNHLHLFQPITIAMWLVSDGAVCTSAPSLTRDANL